MITVPPVPGPMPIVPFYSQFHDIQSPVWQKVGCGIASLAMVIDYYKPDTVSVNVLLGRAILAGAYNQNAGWTHQGLISLSKKYGLNGNSYDFSNLGKEAAFSQLKKSLKDGPVIVSVHYKFDPKSTIPHLVVIDGIDNETIYYNDPAAKTGAKQISTALFLKGWKNRYIVIRPTTISPDVNNYNLSTTGTSTQLQKSPEVLSLTTPLSSMTNHGSTLPYLKIAADLKSVVIYKDKYVLKPAENKISLANLIKDWIRSL